MKKLFTFVAMLLFLAVLTGFAGGDNVELQQADINISASGDNIVIAAVPGRQIIIYKMWLVSNAAVNVTFKNGASTNFNGFAVPLTGQGSSMFFPFDGKSYWETTSGNAFIINNSGAVQITGRIHYALR